MIGSSMMKRIENSRGGYENTGSNLEQEFLGTVKPSQYKEMAYAAIHKSSLPDNATPDQKFASMIKIREQAQREFENTLALAKSDNYLNFRKSMELVEKCQPGNPESPSKFFSKALYDYIRSRFDDKYTLKFFTAVGGTHLDVVHKIDFYFKLYLKETQEELAYATIDITGRQTKDKARADVLLNINPDEKDKYDPSEVNSSFDKEFFEQKIAQFGEEICTAMVENYMKNNS